MSHSSFALGACLVCLFLFYGETAAEERVLRLERDRQHTIGVDYLYYPARIFTAHADKLGFLVYTTQEVDARISPIAAANAQDATAIAELQKIVAALQQNIKDLAAINDALTQRLDELEKMAKQNQ